MFENFKPLESKVLVKIIKEDMQTEAGLFLVEETGEGFRRGRTMAVGPDVVGVKSGDVCIFGKYAGLGVGNGYNVLDTKEIFGVVDSQN